MIKISHTETILENQKFTVNLIYQIPVSICTALMMGLFKPLQYTTFDGHKDYHTNGLKHCKDLTDRQHKRQGHKHRGLSLCLSGRTFSYIV